MAKKYVIYDKDGKVLFVSWSETQAWDRADLDKGDYVEAVDEFEEVGDG